MSAALCLSPIAALPEVPSLRGEDAPEFKEAVQEWLDGDDLTALQKLSGQAQHGNTAAQILLASIALRGNMHKHVSVDLPRNERIALFRRPKGLSGQSWLVEASESEPLAVALIQSKEMGQRGPAVAALVELGEPSAALLVTEFLLTEGRADEVIDVLRGLGDKLPEEAAPLLIWAKYQAANKNRNPYAGHHRVASQLLSDNRFRTSELAWIAPGPFELSENKDLFRKTSKLSADVSNWAPVRKFCSEKCANEVNDCTTLGASFLYYNGNLPLRSPLERVISNEVYWNSPRMEGDMMRLIPDMQHWDRQTLQAANACIVEAIIESQAVHGFGIGTKRIGSD
ncbi:hypothetical protein [uncultured Ruegeria sp.]|uniref:hypothetical protein n=1 Tax=uncultured Ruegeria sp. TaxID=259304 RepID=UPI002638A6C6|nr:hypothetical protein [uncultured Ruegeria sp.]